MAYNVDIGNQKISFDFKQPAKGSEFTRLLFSIIKPGIYKGLDVSIATEDQLIISTGHAFLNCLYQGQTIRGVTVEFTTDFSINVPQSMPGQNEIIYIIYEYAQVIDNYAEIKHINADSVVDIPANAIILCDVSYNSSGFINGIFYEKRSYGLFDYGSNYSLPDINLKFSSYSDKTKKFRFNISNVTSAQTRVIGVPDYDYNIGTIDDWTAQRKYNVKELVIYNSTIYRCNSIHTSSSDFFSDLSQWDSITEVQNEERTRGYSATGVNAGRVVTIVGDYPSQQVPSIDYISSYGNEPFGIVVSNILSGQTGDLIQRGRLVVPSFNSVSGVVGQSVYSDINGNLTLDITPLEVAQLITPALSDSVIYVGILPTEEGINPINFGGQLSTSEDTIQKAFDRLDDYGYTPTWVSSASYRLNNSVNYNGNIYRCISAHTSGVSFDLSKWTIDETLITTNFNDQLTSTENTIQKAFDRLEDYGYTPLWTSGKEYRVSNIVIQNTVIYRCLVNHVSSLDFQSDIFNWTQVNEAPIIPTDPNTYYAGDKVFKTVQKEQVEGIKISQAPEFSAVRVNELDFTSISLDSASGSIVALTSNNRSFIKLTGSGVVLNGIQAPTGTFAQYVAISNTTSSNITVNNESLISASGDRILTGVGNSIVIPSDSSITLLYDFNSLRWRVIGSPVSNHNLLFNLQGGDGTNYYHSDQPINRVDDVLFNTISVKNPTSTTKISAGSVNPNVSGVSGNIGDIYISSYTGTEWSKVGSGDKDWRANWIGNLTNESTGFPVGSDGEVDRLSSTLTFNNSLRQLTISPTGSSYSIVIKNREIIKTAPESVTLLNITGLYFIYFDDNGTLQYSTSFTLDVIYKFVYVAVVYWSATQGQATYIGDERHGCVMDAHTHARFHQTEGAVFIDGSGLNGFNIDGDGTNSNQTQFSIGSGFIRDEDILHSLGQKFTIDSIPVLYRSNTEWLRVSNPSQKFHYNPTGRAYFNSHVAGNYSLTEVGNNNFCLYHIVATNDKDNPYFSLMGINEYLTKSGAREGAITEISQYVGLPFQEFVFIATIIFETKDSYSNTGKSRIVSTDTGATYVDWRFTSTLNPSNANVNNHNNLGGLQGGLGGNFFHSNQPINTTDSVSFNSINTPSLSASGILANTLRVANINYPTVDGASGNVMTTDGSGNVTIKPIVHNDITNIQGGDSLTNKIYHSDQPINKTDSVEFNGVTTNNLKVGPLTYPKVDGTSGQSIVTDGAGNLTFQTIEGGGGGSSTSSKFISSQTFLIGSPVYFGISGWGLALASSDITSGQYVISSITASGSSYEYTAVAVGEVTLATTNWDAITGASGGLTPGSQYYISSNVAGKISTTPGLLYAPVLKALSSTKAFVSFAITNTESGMGDTFYRDTILTNAITTTVTLSYPPAGKAYVWLNIDGVTQAGSDFSLAGNTLILGASVPANTLIDITYARAILLADAGAINRMVSFSETVTGSAKTQFNLPTVPSSASSAIVFVGGSVQDPSKFSISGNVLYFSDPVSVGSKVVAYILNSSGIAGIDSFVTRQTYSIAVNGTVNLNNIFGSQVSGVYRIFDGTDPRISAIVYLKHNGSGIDPDIRVDSNSSSISIVQNTAGKMNLYIASNILTIQNFTSNILTLRLYREV